MSLISVHVDATRAAKALERIADSIDRWLAAAGVPLIDPGPVAEPRSANELSAEVSYDTDEDRKRRELEAMLVARGQAEPDDIDEAAQEPY